MYYNFIVIDDFNIDVNLPSHVYDKLEEFFSLFDVSNLIKSDNYWLIVFKTRVRRMRRIQ